MIELRIDHTNMSGSLPIRFPQLSKLRFLNLALNQFTGSLPDFTGLSSLDMFSVFGNKLNGSLPESIGQLSSLKDLLLSRNSFSGVITVLKLT